MEDKTIVTCTGLVCLTAYASYLRSTGINGQVAMATLTIIALLVHPDKIPVIKAIYSQEVKHE